jgi:hypothetical protein
MPLPQMWAANQNVAVGFEAMRYANSIADKHELHTNTADWISGFAWIDNRSQQYGNE